MGIFENHLDIGDMAEESTAVFEDGVYTITASGREIWNHMDELHFAYIRTNGDFVITAQAESFPLMSEQEWLKVGLVVREDLAPDSAYGLIFVRNDLQMSVAWRPVKGVYPDRSDPFGGALEGDQDGRMQIERIGNTINLNYFNLTAQEWTLFDTWEVDWQNPLYVGLAVSASLDSIGDGIGQVEGTFVDVSYEGTVSVPDWSIY